MKLTFDDLPPPDVKDNVGPGWKRRTIQDFIKNLINTNEYFYKKAKQMSDDYDKATALIEKSQSNFDHALDKLTEKHNELSVSTKNVSENVRKSTQKLNEGLARIEKQANFDRLARYVELLERADKAMSSLAELEQSGRLEKIAKAIN